jgi:hypothetical protein
MANGRYSSCTALAFPNSKAFLRIGWTFDFAPLWNVPQERLSRVLRPVGMSFIRLVATQLAFTPTDSLIPTDERELVPTVKSY